MDKVICLNPNTGSSMRIDADFYHMIHDSITASLRAGEAITYTELVNRVRQHMKKKKNQFPCSLS
jgi:N-dimethylarginine dimethylaminohydrolase